MGLRELNLVCDRKEELGKSFGENQMVCIKLAEKIYEKAISSGFDDCGIISLGKIFSNLYDLAWKI